MKIYSQNHGNMFVLYLDTGFTGNPETDTNHCAMDIAALPPSSESETILSVLIPMISSLVYASYGQPPEHGSPLTDYRRTKFDPNFPNGVKT